MDKRGDKFRRGSNPGQGKEYEINMLALMCLRLITNDSSITQEDLDDFDIAFNIEGMGKFDDLVIFLKKNGVIKQTMAVQLKHKESEKKLTKHMLLRSDSGDYSLLKYAESTPQDKITDNDNNYRFILFSNIKCVLNVNSSIKDQFRIVYDRNQAVPFLNTTIHQSQNDNFRIKPIVDSNFYKHKEFFDKFLLIPNQPNKRQLKQMIQEMFEKIFSAPSCTEEYLNLISAWYDGEIIEDVIHHEPKLDKFRIGKLLVICLLHPLLVNVQLNNDEHTKQWNVFKTVAKQFLVTEVDADIVKKWTWPLEEKNYALWTKNNTEPIIVKIDHKKHSKQILEAIRIIKKINLNKQLIIIGKVEGLDEENANKFTNLFDVQERDDLNAIIDAFYLPLDIGLMDKNNILKITTPTMLFTLLDKPKQKLEDLPECYFSRTIKVPCFSFNEIEKVIQNDFVILRTNHEPDNLKRKLKHLKNTIFTMDEFLNTFPKQPCLVLAKTEDSSIEVSQLFREKFPNENVYLFNHYSTSAIEDSLIKDDKFALISSQKNTQIQIVKDEDFFNQFHNRINILCAEPGMGKTSSMKFFHNKFVSKNYYSKLISFKNHVKFFKDYKNDQNIKSILKYFLNIGNDVNDKSLHIQCYLIRNRVCLFFDGLDELDSKYLENVINCIKKLLTSSQIYKIFISVRKHLKDDLEREFKINIIEISKIDKTEQMGYITNRLLSHYEISEIEEIIATIYNNFAYIQENDKLLGIPLQLYIITEVLIFNVDEPVKELLILSKLYEKFLNGKLEHLQDKKLKNGNFKKLYNLDKHEIFALKVCLDAKDFSKLISSETYDKAVEEFKKSSLTVGILLNWSENNLAIFEHQTIPEYLCASYFVKNCKQNRKFREFIFNSKYNIIRYFMDMKLAENSELHLAVLYRQYNFILESNIKDIQNARDEVKRNLLQLSICYGQDYPKLEQIKNEKKTYEIPKTITSNNESNLMKHLTNNICLKNEKDDLFAWSSTEYAIHLNNLCTMNNILNIDTKNNFLIEYCLKNEPSILGYSSINGFTNLLDKCSVDSIHNYLYYRRTNYYSIDYFKTIHLAVKSGQVDILKKLILQYNMDINCQDNAGSTPLHSAAKDKNVKCFKALIELPNLDINCQDNYGYTALHFVSENGNFECLKELIEWPNLNNNCQNKYGFTALHSAAKAENVKCLKALIELPNLDINCQDNYGYTALHFVAENGNVECLKELIKLPNLNINCQNKYGFTALHYIALNNNVECMNELIKLVNLDINCQDEYGSRILHYVALNNNVECLKKLIKLPNLDINYQNNYGCTALHYVVKNGHRECLKELIKLPYLDINCQSNYGRTALHYVIKNEHFECLKELIKLTNLDINSQDEDGSTALHYAAKNGNLKCFKELVKLADLDINCQNNNGYTALQYAVRYRNVECLRELIKLPNLKITCQDKNGYTDARSCKRKSVN